jgi:hypothetical protein
MIVLRWARFAIFFDRSHCGFQLKELYELLSANYVEDDDASFRFQYTAEFLQWCVSHGYQM